MGLEGKGKEGEIRSAEQFMSVSVQEGAALRRSKLMIQPVVNYRIKPGSYGFVSNYVPVILSSVSKTARCWILCYLE